jgi:hypothetical protein
MNGVDFAERLAVNLLGRYKDAISVSTEKTSACFHFDIPIVITRNARTRRDVNRKIRLTN